MVRTSCALFRTYDLGVCHSGEAGGGAAFKPEATVAWSYVLRKVQGIMHRKVDCNPLDTPATPSLRDARIEALRTRKCPLQGACVQVLVVAFCVGDHEWYLDAMIIDHRDAGGA